MTVGSPTRWLVILALFMRIAVPSGFMLAPGAAATPTLQLCDGHGPAFATAPSDHRHQHGDHGSSAHYDCPFAAAGAADLPVAAPPVVRGAGEFAPPAGIATHRGWRPLTAAPPPPSTGPPSIA